MVLCLIVIALLMLGLLILILGKHSSMRLEQVEDEFGVLAAAELLRPSLEDQTYLLFNLFAGVANTRYQIGETLDVNLFFRAIVSPTTSDGYKICPEKDVRGLGIVHKGITQSPTFEVTHLSIGRIGTSLSEDEAEAYLISLLRQIVEQYYGEMIIRGNLLVDLDAGTRELFHNVLNRCGFTLCNVGFSCVCNGIPRSIHAH